MRKDRKARMLALRRLSLEELRQSYEEIFGEKTTTRNRGYLLKRIAYHIQEGGPVVRRDGGHAEPGVGSQRLQS
jgi:hypothetical protein